MTIHCFNCGKRGPRENHYHTKIQASGTEQVPVARWTRDGSQAYETQTKWVDVPYTGNLKITHDSGALLTLGDGQSYKLNYGHFCTMRCAWEYAESVAAPLAHQGENHGQI